ncbi:MAG: hypothetical protein U5K43_09945 [Halofilum sp. (in: g-proteobacteria)]|nr:hypothetical protein [Halofilum sp. (in: g-proteobacteria)]
MISAIHDATSGRDYYVDLFVDIDRISEGRDRLEFVVNHDALRAAQPAPVPGPPRAGAAARGALRRRPGGADLHRPRPLQGGQRLAGPSLRRPGADPGGRGPAGMPARRRHDRPGWAATSSW